MCTGEESLEALMKRILGKRARLSLRGRLEPPSEARQWISLRRDSASAGLQDVCVHRR